MSEIKQKNFTVYRSSAGSGKTYTLVKEYLKIILAEPSKFRSVLAITFTNKAASEMKERVLRYLKDISNDSENSQELLNSLVSETDLSREQLIHNSSEALSLILHNYSDFSISTIDSFVHRVIRSFAIDLDLAMNFEVEMDTDELVSKCIDLLLDKAGTDKELTKVLLDFIKYKSSEDRNLYIEYDLMKFAKHLNKELVQNYLEDFRKLTPKDFENVSRKTGDFIRQFKSYISGVATEAFKIISDKGILNTSFFHGRQGIGVYFKNLSEGRYDKLEPNSYVHKTVNENKWISGNPAPDDVISIEEIKEQLVSAYDKIVDRITADLSRYETYKNLNSNIYQLAVLNQIEKVIDDFKKQNNLLLITEFNKKISEIVFNEPVPFIYERLGERFKHFFIDEFQDTSVLQWMNLLPLLDNSLAEGNFNMVVGDGKQAIYRFRNGDVEQFVRLPEIADNTDNAIIKEREESLKRNFRAMNLGKNYRSRQEVVEFNNKLFSYVYDHILTDDIKAVYENSNQEINDNNSGGFVSIDFFNKDKETGLLIDDQNLNRTLEIIRHQHELGYDYKDIAILCRKKRYGSELAYHLTINDIPVVSSESLLLAYSPSVSFLISCMKLIFDPQDGILLEEFRRFLSNNNKHKAGREEMAVAETVAVEEFDFADGKVFSGLTKLPVYDCCEELIRIFGLNDESDPYIHYFLDTIFDYTSRYNSGITDFLEWWDDNKEKPSLIIPEETDAVRIMTIHKAKGLEFPVVIFPYANEELSYRGNVLWISNNDKEIPELPFLMLNANTSLESTEYNTCFYDEKNKSLLDLLNLLYVVMTRAVDSLYVLSERVDIKKSSKGTETPKVQTILRDFLIVGGIWSDEQSTYTFGEEKVKQEDKKAELQGTYKLEQAVSEDWRTRAMISKRAPEMWDMESPDRNRQWGNLVHAVLAKIRHTGDKESVLNKFYTEGYIDKTEKNNLSMKIDEVLNNQSVKSFFEDGREIKSEAEILLANGKSYRPDRVVITGKKAVVIDYKTGKSSEYHKTQLRNYASLLKDMGYEVDKKYLIYIDDEVEVVEV